MQDSKIDVQAILHLLKRRKWFLIIPLILACIGGYIRIITLVSEYKATVTIMLGKKSFMTSDLKNQLPGVTEREKMKLRDEKETITKHIKSNVLLTQVVEKLGLDPSAVQEEKAKKLVAAQEDISIEQARNTVLAASIRGSVEVEFPRRGDYIEVSCTSKDPEKAYLVAKTLADVFIEDNLVTEQYGVRSVEDFSNEQLEIYRDKLEYAEERLRAYQRSINANAPSKQLTVSPTSVGQIKGVISSYNVDISEKVQEMSELEALLGRDASEIRVKLSDRASSMRNSLIEKVTDLSELAVSHKWDQGDVLRLNGEIKDLKESLENEIRRSGVRHLQGVFQSSAINAAARREILGFEIDLLQRQVSTLNRFVNAYNATTNQMPVHEVTLQKYQMEVDKNRQMYQTFLDQVRSAQIRTAMQALDKDLRFRIIDPAQLPTEPINASTNQVIIISLLLGLGLGGGFIYTLEFIDQSFKSVEEVENYLGLVVLGTVPKIDFEERMGKSKKRKLPFF